jgi:hypothetical protein
LEAMAFLAQLRFIQSHFGTDGVHEFRNTLYNFDRFAEKYVGVVEAAARLGLVPFESRGESQLVNPTFLESVIFASLQPDYVTAPGSLKEASVDTSYPADRLVAIAEQLKQDYPKLDEVAISSFTFDEGWDLIDRACLKAFGRSVADQIEADVSYFEKQHEEKCFGRVPEMIETILRDYLALRRKLLTKVRSAPADVISNDRFVHHTSELIEPNFVMCASGGVMGVPPPGCDRLMGFAEPGSDFDKYPYRKWWWACTPIRKDEAAIGDPVKPSAEMIRFDCPKAWYSCIDLYAPIAKLLMNGRRVRTMLGPELLFAEKRMETEFGIKTEIFPFFEYPDEDLNTEVYFYYYGRDTLKCDLSSQDIHRPGGKVLTPWTLRRWPLLANHAIQKLGGNDFAYYTFVRDWSPWVVTEEVLQGLSPLMRPVQAKDRVYDFSKVERASRRIGIFNWIKGWWKWKS